MISEGGMTLPTAHEVLVYLFNYFEFGNDLDAYPFEMRLVNWEEALKIKVNKKDACDEQKVIDLLFQVGFSKERVANVVDPGLIPLISRLLDLKILTFFSCSGHPRDTRGTYLVMAFPTEAFGRTFLTACKEVFLPEETFWLSGYRAGIIGRNIASVYLPIGVCLQNRLPIGLHWEPPNIRECAEVWRKFSRVIDLFDHQGEYIPTQKMLRQRVSYGFCGEMIFDEVLESLFAFGYESDRRS